MARGSEGVVVGGDSGDEAQNTDEQKHCSDCQRSSLQGGLPLNCGLSFAMVHPPSVEKLPWCGALLVLGQLPRESWSVAQVGFHLLWSRIFANQAGAGCLGGVHARCRLGTSICPPPCRNTFVWSLPKGGSAGASDSALHCQAWCHAPG